MLSRHIDSISCSLERHVRGLGLDKVSLYTSDFLMALRESLTGRSNLAEEGFAWLMVWRITVHHGREGANSSL